MAGDVSGWNDADAAAAAAVDDDAAAVTTTTLADGGAVGSPSRSG